MNKSNTMGLGIGLIIGNKQRIEYQNNFTVCTNTAGAGTRSNTASAVN